MSAYTIIAQREKIERLEAELADLVNRTEMFRQQAIGQAAEIDGLQRELADLRASSVAYKVRCETCGGSGTVTHPGATEREHLEGLRELPCDCDNGWRLAEGVERLDLSHECGLADCEGAQLGYWFPARLIKGNISEEVQ